MYVAKNSKNKCRLPITLLTQINTPAFSKHMHPTPYQQTIKEALNTLIGVNESIYNSIVNISMQGELKEFNDAVPIGETYQLDFEIFKNSSDTNM